MENDKKNMTYFCMKMTDETYRTNNHIRHVCVCAQSSDWRNKRTYPHVLYEEEKILHERKVHIKKKKSRSMSNG